MNYCFYLDWNGLSAQEWAAIGQAILSALAILAALYVVHVQHRLALRQRAESIVILLQYADSIATAAATLAATAVGTTTFQYRREAVEAPLLKQLQGIPVWDLPMSVLAAPVLDTVACFGRVTEKVEAVRFGAANAIAVQPDDVIALRLDAKVIAEAHAKAAAAVNGYSVWAIGVG